MSFVHEALLYGSADHLLRETVPMVRSALDDGRPVMVAMVAERSGAMAAALGADADRVRFADMAELGRNPARIIPAWQEFVDGADGAAFGIGEPVWPGRSEDEIDECVRHECLLNVAFEHAHAFTLICPYDEVRLPRAVLDAAHGCHGAAATTAVDPFQGTLPAPDGATRALGFGAGELGGVREFVATAGRAAGLSRGRVADLVLAVGEIAANSVRHGGGTGVVRTWTQDADFVCEVCDSGVIADPLAGRRSPTLHQDSGRGLWIAHQLCDLVRVRSGAGGTRVRLHMAPRPVAAPA